MKSLLIASDPEMFTKKRDGAISSVAGLLGCSKTNKIDLGGVRLQEDNVLVEFDVDPCSTFDGFDALMKKGISESESIIKKFDLEIAEGVSSYIFTPEEMRGFHKDAFEFGCSPDFNGLTGEKNPKPRAPNKGLRSAGGHVHIGFCDGVPVTDETQMFMTILCDMFLGMPSLLLDDDTRRRQLYGAAGSIRYKTYGIEYRSMSNFWIFNRTNRLWAWEQTQKAYGHLKDGNALDLFSMVDPVEIQRVINANDRVMAEQYVKLCEIM